MKFIFTILLLISSSAFAANDDFKVMLERYLAFNKERADYLVSNKEKIVGIEIIIADQANGLASRFGHALLRFVDKDGLWANDAVVSFGALSEEETYSLWKGVFGGYPILPQVMNLHEYWTQYTKTERRDLKRYVLNLSPEQLEQFIDVSFKYIQAPEKLKNYTFTKNNCVGVISKFLIEAGLTVDSKQAIIPSNVHNWLRKNNLTVFPEFTMKNPAQLEGKLAAQDVNKLSSEQLLQNFNMQELSYIYLNKNDLSFAHFNFLSKHLVNTNADIDDAFSFTDLSLKLYDRCLSLKCFRDFNKFEKQLKTKDQLDIISHRLLENSKMQDLYLEHREFTKLNLVKLDGMTMTRFQLKRSKDKIYFKGWATHKNYVYENDKKEFVSVALQLTLNADKVMLADEEVGILTKKGLELQSNYRLVLHQEKDHQVLALIKI